ncbi:MAG: inorganic phosphate transporter [Bacteroidales bacterium]|jgi:phosphate/sulfate permease|nr:inorganic phosphate transporter [Bacteroidales bacterium]
MENFYLILVVILFALAISDLIVGVSNDAVNFLGSAIGSKAAPKWAIFLLASIGVLIGATFSNGMMEVARKGIFHPDMFYFSEIMVIFLAVMITDVILLDIFNTFGMPTSTTVSIVFELLGSAVAVSIVKIKSFGGNILELSNYINSDKALAIIFGILVSVIIAFSVGAIVQYVTRFIFSFRYSKTLKYFGSIYGGLAITGITYFILIKGIDGSSFSGYQLQNGETFGEWVSHSTVSLLLYSFIGWTILLQLLNWIFKFDVLRFIVLVGTFALAMAFAGNDLVNFIGVPVAGFKSFQAWIASGGAAPGAFTMDVLNEESTTPIYMLIISGLVMVITLIVSKKARAVTKTQINLGRQSEGAERFGSSLISRVIVRSSLNINKSIQKIIPECISQNINKRFVPVPLGNADSVETPAFDKVRASVNLMVASILIAFGTSLQLPLSTTYVTFMVAMGTSLSDRAWDRESAVYRISGVFAVIGGWFLTAIIAFTVSAIIALCIAVGGKFMIFVFIVIALIIIIRTHIFFEKMNHAKIGEEEEEIISEKDETEKIIAKCNKQVMSGIVSTSKIFSIAIDNFLNEDRIHLKEGVELKNEMNRKSKKQKTKLLNTISKIEGDIDSGHFYVQIMDYQREVAHSLNFIVEPLFEHIDNHHKPFSEAQSEELKKLIAKIDEFLNFSLYIVKENKFLNIEELIQKRAIIFELLGEFEKAQIKRIKDKTVNTRNSVLFFNIITETKNMLLHYINLIKSYRDFITVNTK